MTLTHEEVGVIVRTAIFLVVFIILVIVAFILSSESPPHPEIDLPLDHMGIPRGS